MSKKAKTVKRPRMDSEKVAKLYKQLDKSISAVAKKVGATYCGVRNNLIASRTIRVK